ncbi:MAG: DUF3892 domain-containing protein [Anaerocolumna sp.]
MENLNSNMNGSLDGNMNGSSDSNTNSSLNGNMNGSLNSSINETNISNGLNKKNNINPSQLPMMALEDIPVQKPDAKQIVALVKTSGKVTGYQLSDGQVLNKEAGVTLARQGGIAGVGIGVRNGNEYLKSLPDGSDKNNLGNLPAISSKSESNNVK